MVWLRRSVSTVLPLAAGGGRGISKWSWRCSSALFSMQAEVENCTVALSLLPWEVREKDLSHPERNCRPSWGKQQPHTPNSETQIDLLSKCSTDLSLVQQKYVCVGKEKSDQGRKKIFMVRIWLSSNILPLFKSALEYLHMNLKGKRFANSCWTAAGGSYSAVTSVT